jgi:hypothetical protein
VRRRNPLIDDHSAPESRFPAPDSGGSARNADGR